MPIPRRRPPRLPVVIDSEVWKEEVERLAARSPARLAAERERSALERDGISVSSLLRCDPEGAARTRLEGLVKAYVPLTTGPSSERPYGFVFSPERDPNGPYLELVAFGERHPRSGSRSVYQRAHKRLHGRYPDQ